MGKQKATEKIDGAVALVMALDRAMRNNGFPVVFTTDFLIGRHFPVDYLDRIKRLKGIHDGRRNLRFI